MTRFGRFLDRSLKDLAAEAARSALADASIAAQRVQLLVFSNVLQGAMEGQTSVRGQMISTAAGLDGVPVINVENACASGTTALHVAASRIKAGECDIALALGAEKMAHADKAKSFEAFKGGWDMHDGGATFANLERLAPSRATAGVRRSQFMDVYASLARHHMDRYGTTQRQLAVVAAKNHGHSVLNERAQYRNAFTPEEVLQAREISWPLTLPMCAPISDGAAAALLCSERALHRLGSRGAVRIRGAGLAAASDRPADDLDRHVAKRAAKLAYEQAGVGPEDINVAEVHDATSFAEILHTENLGFCARGEGGRFAEAGRTRLGGQIPINPSGGLVSRGHPVGASGLAQIFELVTQLRGEAGARQVSAARLAVAENGGGLKGYEEAAACVTVLEKC
jgi:acetyl-CoA acetyltransferase